MTLVWRDVIRRDVTQSTLYLMVAKWSRFSQIKSHTTVADNQPAIPERVTFNLRLQCTSCSKQNCGVQVTDYSLNRARCVDAGLGTTRTLLQSS